MVLKAPLPMLTWTWYLATPDGTSVADQVILERGRLSIRPEAKATVAAFTTGPVTSPPTVIVRVVLAVSVPSLIDVRDHGLAVKAGLRGEADHAADDARRARGRS